MTRLWRKKFGSVNGQSLRAALLVGSPFETIQAMRGEHRRGGTVEGPEDKAGIASAASGHCLSLNVWVQSVLK